MTRYRTADGGLIDAVQAAPGTPRHIIDQLVGYPHRPVPRYWLWDWLIRHPDGGITVCDPEHFHTLYDPREETS